MEQFLQAETLTIELLLIAALVAIAVQRLRIPYTVALVVVGLIITYQSPLALNLTPELILTIFVPPLVFEAAFHLHLAEIRRNLAGILLLAVPGVLVTMLLVGAIMAGAGVLSWPIALVFGALISATDPVAVVAVFRVIGVPKRLAVLVESESLFNDGTAIVLFNLVLAIAITGQVDAVAGIVDFMRVSAGGIAVGVVLGWLTSYLIGRVDDYLIEITLTTVLAFGAYLVAERLDFSGVLAVVSAGIIAGNFGPQGMSPTTRIVLFNFWEYVAFLANSLVFLLIGLQVNIPVLAAAWQPVVWAIVAVLVARVVVVYGFSWLAGRLAEPIPVPWQHVLTWGGLRGAISLALALSLPTALGDSVPLLRTMAFGVVLFTLLVPGLTMGRLIRHLKIVTRGAGQVEYEMRHARLTALRVADARLDRLHAEGLLSTPTWENLKPLVTRDAAQLADSVRSVLATDPGLAAEELDTGWRELIRAQRSAVQGLQRDGVISEDVFETLLVELDAQLQNGPPEVRPPAAHATQTLEVTIASDSVLAGRLVRDLALPSTLLLVSIRRLDDVFVPHGDTELHTGDIVTVLFPYEQEEEVHAVLSARRPAPTDEGADEGPSTGSDIVGPLPGKTEGC